MIGSSWFPYKRPTKALPEAGLELVKSQEIEQKEEKAELDKDGFERSPERYNL